LLARDAFDTIFGDPRAVSAGSLNPMTSQAAKVDGGWRFSGGVTYTSGSAHATYLMATAVVLHDGVPRIVDGIPHLRAGMFPIQNVKILNTWSTAGMRGTGSNDCAFENVFVPDEFTVDWLNATPTWQQGPFANIPLPLQVASGLATVVQAAPEQLAQTDILLVQGLPPDSDYHFKHALIQDAAYENLLRRRRQVLHRRVAEILI
jgi:hypothetical protein